MDRKCLKITLNGQEMAKMGQNVEKPISQEPVIALRRLTPQNDHKNLLFGVLHINNIISWTVNASKLL